MGILENFSVYLNFSISLKFRERGEKEIFFNKKIREQFHFTELQVREK